MQTLVIFDIGDTPLRTRVASACKDAGLLRTQYSAYLGECADDARERLRGRVEAMVAAHAQDEDDDQRQQRLHVQFFVVCAADFERAFSISREGVSAVQGFEQPEVAIF